MKIGIIGFGGFGNEIYWSLSPIERKKTVFFVDEKFYKKGVPNLLPISELDVEKYLVTVAIADSKVRENIINKLPSNTKYFTHVHPSVQIHGDDVFIGEGSVICAGTIITCNVKIGKHSHLNLITTIGHDCVIGDFFTTAPGVQISGNVEIGKNVYFGTRSCVKQKINICDNVIIGMNAGVVKNISEPGTYIGTPALKIK